MSILGSVLWVVFCFAVGWYIGGGLAKWHYNRKRKAIERERMWDILKR